MPFEHKHKDWTFQLLEKLHEVTSLGFRVSGFRVCAGVKGLGPSSGLKTQIDATRKVFTAPRTGDS